MFNYIIHQHWETNLSHQISARTSSTQNLHVTKYSTNDVFSGPILLYRVWCIIERRMDLKHDKTFLFLWIPNPRRTL